MWNIPPIVGQKVMLDPSHVHYKDFNRAQARGNDGYILAVTGMNLVKWLINASEPAITVMWENGHENSYELKVLLPIDSFKTIERVEFKGGSFLNVVSEKSRDYIAERVILKNDDVKHYNFFDKEKRLEILRKAEEVYGTLNEEVRHKESVQMKYMSILEEIERTKRAEEVALFLDSEGDDVPKPKKNPSGLRTTLADSSSLDYADIERTVRNMGTGAVGWIDADFLNPCAEVEALNPYQLLDEVRMSPYMEQMQRLGAESRATSEAEKQEQIRAYREAFGLAELRTADFLTAFNMDLEPDDD